MNDKGWQELINKFGIEGAFQVLMSKFKKLDKQPDKKS